MLVGISSPNVADFELGTLRRDLGPRAQRPVWKESCLRRYSNITRRAQAPKHELSAQEDGHEPWYRCPVDLKVGCVGQLPP